MGRDTVASVGVIMGRTLPFTNSNTSIKTFRHALSLDEVSGYRLNNSEEYVTHTSHSTVPNLGPTTIIVPHLRFKPLDLIQSTQVQIYILKTMLDQLLVKSLFRRRNDGDFWAKERRLRRPLLLDRCRLENQMTFSRSGSLDVIVVS